MTITPTDNAPQSYAPVRASSPSIRAIHAKADADALANTFAPSVSPPTHEPATRASRAASPHEPATRPLAYLAAQVGRTLARTGKLRRTARTLITDAALPRPIHYANATHGNDAA